MFGRQNVDDDEDQNKELDNQQAAYVSDLTANDLLPPPPTTLPTITPSASFTGSMIQPSPVASLSAPLIPPPSDEDSGQAAPGFDVGSVVANTQPIPGGDTAAPALTSEPSNQDQLLDIKHQALNELSPLITHLDQTPEEKFKTTMMLIQASDDSSLIAQAHEAAKAITDSKARAQALLDIVNEINYFTQHKQH
ncbi:MAG: hypothetical protein WBP26_05465 [Candidatus Saccharimonadales bacterium]